jgi:hypothetical protein
MDPIIGGALISGASSLLGGIFGKSKSEYVVPNYQKIRTKAEAAGFNPLTALAMAPGQVVQSQNFMGSAIADAGLALADGIVAKHKEQGALAKLAEENDKLREKVQNMTLRPKVGGVYAQREAIPSVSQAVGGSNAGTVQNSGQTVHSSVANSGGVSSGASDASGGVSGVKADASGQSVDVFDPTRQVDKLKITSDAGVGVIDNAVTGPFHIPLVNGEMPDLTQLLVLGGSYLADRSFGWAYRQGENVASERWKQGLIDGYKKNGTWKNPAFPAPDRANAFNFQLGRHRPTTAYGGAY